jgi:hypothetical protein
MLASSGAGAGATARPPEQNAAARMGSDSRADERTIGASARTWSRRRAFGACGTFGHGSPLRMWRRAARGERESTEPLRRCSFGHTAALDAPAPGMAWHGMAGFWVPWLRQSSRAAQSPPTPEAPSRGAGATPRSPRAPPPRGSARRELSEPSQAPQAHCDGEFSRRADRQMIRARREFRAPPSLRRRRRRGGGARSASGRPKDRGEALSAGGPTQDGGGAGAGTDPAVHAYYPRARICRST